MSLKTHQPELRRTASKLCQLNKGILAADESNPTMKKRFDLFNIENTFKNRMNYRKLLFEKGVSKVSVIGVGMITTPGVTFRMFQALANKKINIQVISTSEIKISVLIDKKNTKKALIALHKEFKLDN